MREIKFRGKLIDNGEWVYGWLVIQPEGTAYISRYYKRGEWEQVDPETVGQYTGLKDRNGKEIYVGDIIDHFATFGYVIFEDGMFTLNSSAKVNFGHRQPLCYIDTLECEIIGNVFENPNLLAVNES